MTNVIVEGGPDRVSVVVPPSSIKVSYDVGRTGRRGSIWFSGSGAPGPLTLPEVELFVNDMYMDSVSGWVWQYILLPNNTADWVKAYQASAAGGGGAASSAIVTVPNIGWTDSTTLTVAGLTGPHVVAPVTAEGAQAWAAGQWWASSPADGQLTITGTIQPSADPVDVRVVWWE